MGAGTNVNKPACEPCRRTTEFLWAASQGNEAKVRQMLQQGCPADSAGEMLGRWAGPLDPPSLCSGLPRQLALFAAAVGWSTIPVLWPTQATGQGTQRNARAALSAQTRPLCHHSSCTVPWTTRSADYDARTALELACVKGHGGVVDLLLAAGADVNSQVGGGCSGKERKKEYP